MRGTLRVIFLSLLLTPVPSHSQDRSLYISPLVSYDSFRTPGFENGIDLGAGAGLHVSPSVAVSASITFGQRSLTFDVIGGSRSSDATITALTVSIEVLLLGHPGGADVSATLGAGSSFTTVDAQTVSLGALGSLEIPARSSARGFMQAGVAGELPLSSTLSAVVLPSVRLFIPHSSSADFAIAGGLRVGIL